MYSTTQIDNRARHYERMETAASSGDKGAAIRMAWLSYQKKAYTADEFRKMRST